MEFFRKSGSRLSNTMSEIISLPSGFRTLNASEKTFVLSGERLITQFEITTSTELSATGRFSISPTLNSTFSYSPFLAFSRAFSIISGVISTPMTFPVFPTLFAARKQSKPAPAPRSRTVSPFLKVARATGFPQPRPKFAPSGTTFSSSSVYPSFLLIRSASSLLPKPELTGPQQELFLFAILAYPSFTAFLISLLSILIPSKVIQFSDYHTLHSKRSKAVLTHHPLHHWTK